MKRILVVFSLFVIAQVVNSQAEWIYFFTTSDGDWYYDRNSILVATDNNKEYYKVWIKLIYANPEFDESEYKYKETILYQDIYYCGQRLVKTASMITYFTDNTFRQAPKYILGRLEDIIPNTPPDGMYDLLCE